ncbi:MAG: glycoside hydrolase family 2 protein, partial [Lachnospiraceae bacterium]|nr:glycoside hydrolase family 2 protein [Lachnospiraceae bacterium]
YCYTKRFTPPAEYRDKTLLLEFEGVYRHASVYVNGQKAAFWAYGYTGFWVMLQPYLHYDEENVILVAADNGEQPNSRWYSGSGIYRRVNLWVGGKEWIGPEDIFIATRSCEPAVISIDIQNRTALAACGEEGRSREAGSQEESRQGLTCQTQILYEGKVVAELEGRSGEAEIPEARLWSDQDPALYLARVTLKKAGHVVDVQEVGFGIRQLAWNAKEGLLVNGVSTKLRGACIHHDNGVIGACAFAMAEERKIRILKEAGFNAIRCAHNPCSKAMLDACDRYGMYVMDEAFDAWYIPKNSRDYAVDFTEWHERDLEAMIRKDYNHPSVILYSLGNETIETAQQKGVHLVEEMRSLVKRLDDTRPITCGISITQNIDEYQGKASAKEQHMGGIEKAEEKKEQADPAEAVTAEMLAGVNLYMEKLGRDNEEIAGTQIAEDAVKDVCRYLDIAGYNYGECKTQYDKIHNPDRVVVSSETHHTQIPEHWELVEKTPHLIGDFMWTGWDYIGEAGIGALGYPSRGGIGFDKPYPYLTGASGIIDITGFIRPEVYWTQMAWHMRTEPVIAVEPVERSGEPYMMTYWNDTEGFPAGAGTDWKEKRQW